MKRRSLVSGQLVNKRFRSLVVAVERILGVGTKSTERARSSTLRCGGFLNCTYKRGRWRNVGSWGEAEEAHNYIGPRTRGRQGTSRLDRAIERL